MSRPSRKVVAYALAIAVPTLVLLALGLQSVRRQQQAIAQLEQANRRLQAERLAAALASRVASAASAALRDEQWRVAVVDGRPSPVALRRLARRHPVVRQLLVVADRDVRYPRLVTPLDTEERQEPACQPSMAEAEALEFSGQVGAALRAYGACLAGTTAAPVRATLLARIARAERRRGNTTRATEAYTTLVREHGDDDDRFGRPFGLVAALELHDLQPGGRADLLRQVRADLVQGRWNVSEEQARYFLEELRGRLGAPLPSTEAGPLLDALAVARTVQPSLPLQASTGPGDIASDDVILEGRRTRLHHAAVGDPAAGLRAVVVPDGRWIETQALPAAQREVGVSGEARLASDEPLPGAGGIVATAEGLAPWRVWVAPPPDGVSARWPLALQGAITLLVSGVLGLGVVLLVRDVRREQSLAQMRSQFVSAASHELRTPLAMILLYAQTLLEDVDADREERRGSYEIIAQESERLRHLLDKVLDFSRIDGGRRSYRFEVGDLDESVLAAARLIEPQLVRRGFVLETDIAGVPDVRHDTEAITGAVINLLENAAKYSGSSRRIALTVRDTGAEARISVRDHGIGIPPEDLPRIGERFFRTRLSASIGGYGLGLFLVQHAMAAHSGRLDIDSAPGEGSTFTLVLPRRGAPEAKEIDA